MANEHVETLKAARAEMINSRRGLAKQLAVPYTRGQSEQWCQMFLEITATIEAIDKAIQDEEKPDKEKPEPSFWEGKDQPA